MYMFFFFFQAEDGIRDVAVTGVQTCALPILTRPLLTSSVRRPSVARVSASWAAAGPASTPTKRQASTAAIRSEEHTSELQSRLHLVCRLLLEKKKHVLGGLLEVLLPVLWIVQ